VSSAPNAADLKRTWRVTASDQEGNRFETTVRAAAQAEAVESLRRRGLIDARAVEVSPVAPTTSVDPEKAKEAWNIFLAELKSLPKGGRSFGRAVEETVRFAREEKLSLENSSENVPESVRLFLNPVREQIRSSAQAPTFATAIGRSRVVTAEWHLRTIGPMAFCLITPWFLGALWLSLGKIIGYFSKTYGEFGMALPWLTQMFIHGGPILLKMGFFLLLVYFFAALVLSLTYFGEHYQISRRTRFQLAFALLRRGGLPVPSSLVAAAGFADSRRLISEVETVLRRAGAGIDENKLLSLFPEAGPWGGLASLSDTENNLVPVFENLAEVNYLARVRGLVTLAAWLVGFSFVLAGIVVFSLMAPLFMLLKRIG